MRHPNYHARSKYHDIALLELKASVEFSYYVWPACIYAERDLHDRPLVIAGFGRTDEINSELVDGNDVNTNRIFKFLFRSAPETKRSDWMLKATVYESKLDECRAEYKFYPIRRLNEGITDDLICAKSRGQHADTCEGEFD